MFRLSWLVWIVFIACLSGGLVATVRPAAAQPAASGTFVGQVEGSDAFIAIVADGRGVTAYLCDGTPAGVSLWGWFAGEAANGHAELVATNGVVLLLDLSGDAPAGTVITRQGQRLAVHSEAATGAAGLWRAQGVVGGAALLAGWVVLNDGEQRGGSLADGSVRVAPPLGIRDGTSNIVDGTSNTVVFPGGALLAGRVR
jgi:hypothetical protein